MMRPYGYAHWVKFQVTVQLLIRYTHMEERVNRVYFSGIIAAKRLLYFDFRRFAPALRAEPQNMGNYTIPALPVWYHIKNKHRKPAEGGFCR